MIKLSTPHSGLRRFNNTKSGLLETDLTFSYGESRFENAEMYNTQQRFLLYRFHVPDPICFEKDFRMTLDNLGWTGPRYDDYTSVAYWYQTLPAAPLSPLPPDGDCIMK